MSPTFSDNIHSFNVSNNFNFTASDNESDILTWLSPLDPQVRHQDIRSQRVESVGSWLLQTNEFRSWYDGNEKDEPDHPVLFCYGHPGVGKSYISSLVIDTLCDRAPGKNSSVACFYFDFADRKEQSPINMLGSLLKQLLNGSETIPEEVVREFQDQKKVIGGRGLQVADVVNLFRSTSSSQPMFICVDAIDECVPEHRIVVFGALSQILRSSPKTRIFMTGRPHIRAEIERRLGATATSVFIKLGRDDILRYLRDRLSKDTTIEAMDSRLEGEILKSVPGTTSETFLLVSLHIEAILRETTIYRRRRRLRAMTDGLGLGDAYDSTIERIKVQDKEKAKLGMATLMWICHSVRPLQVNELCHALAVEIGSTDFDTDNVPSMQTLLDCCQGLITVDKEASTVRLIHFTLREYLSSNPDIFGRAHSKIAETCLTYLSSSQIMALSANTLPDLGSTPFLKYSSRYWGTHSKRQLSDYAKFLALELLGKYDKHISGRLLVEQIFSRCRFNNINTPSLFTGLHGASFFGIVELARALIEIKSFDINQKDRTGITPLSWAAHKGHEEMVKLLLEQEDIEPDKPDNIGQTSILWAAANGNEGVVKLLLEREDVDPDYPDNEGRSSLSWAAAKGHVEVVKVLLQRQDVDPGRPDGEGRTPLWWAAYNGHEVVIKLLLEPEDIRPDTPDHEGQTPLARAARNGHTGVVKLLMERDDVNADTPDQKGRTPLSWAVAKGHKGVVGLLLEREIIKPDKPDKMGQTPILWAAANGNEGVMGLLLERKDLNPDMPDNKGRTPLSHAAAKGHEAVVTLLLDREDVNPGNPDNEDRTPLWFAARNKHTGVMKLLMQRNEVNADIPDKKGRTLLSWAAAKGHGRVVKLLLEQPDIRPDLADKEGRTPLLWAARNGHTEVVNLLLTRDGVNADMPDEKGRTPLSWAAAKGREAVVRLLLERQDVNPDELDRRGQTPVLWAAAKGHEAIVKLLLDHGGVDPDRPDFKGYRPLEYAATSGYFGVVWLLEAEISGFFHAL